MATILYLVTDGRNVENMTTLELAYSKLSAFVQKKYLRSLFLELWPCFVGQRSTVGVEGCSLLVFISTSQFSDTVAKNSFPCFQPWRVHRPYATKLLSPPFILFLFSISLFILYSAPASVAGTGCFILTKDCSKQVRRGGRDLFLLWIIQQWVSSWHF